MPPRNVVLHIAASQDGFIATEDDGLAWLPQPNEEQDYGMNAFMASVDCVVMGRRTWEVAQTLEETPFAAYDRHVCSFTTGDARPLVEALKSQSGEVIWLLGGGILNASMLEANLIDTMVITRIPVKLKKGIPLFGPLGTEVPKGWKREEQRTYEGGVIQTTWSFEKSAERGI